MEGRSLTGDTDCLNEIRPLLVVCTFWQSCYLVIIGVPKHDSIWSSGSKSEARNGLIGVNKKHKPIGTKLCVIRLFRKGKTSFLVLLSPFITQPFTSMANLCCRFGNTTVAFFGNLKKSSTTSTQSVKSVEDFSHTKADVTLWCCSLPMLGGETASWSWSWWC